MLVYWGSVPTPMNITLGHGDYSDGIIAFHAPEGAICEKDTVDNVCHTFAIGDSIWGVVIGMLYFSTFIEVYLKRTEAIRSFTKFSIFFLRMEIRVSKRGNGSL